MILFLLYSCTCSKHALTLSSSIDVVVTCSCIWLQSTVSVENIGIHDPTSFFSLSSCRRSSLELDTLIRPLFLLGWGFLLLAEWSERNTTTHFELFRLMFGCGRISPTVAIGSITLRDAVSQAHPHSLKVIFLQIYDAYIVYWPWMMLGNSPIVVIPLASARDNAHTSSIVKIVCWMLLKKRR